MNDDYKLIELIEKLVLDFPEVSRFADPTLTENIQAVFTRDRQNPGIKVSSDNDEAITIHIEIIVYYGTHIPRLCYDIQSKVKKYLEDMTGVEVKAVNINVAGIDNITNPTK